MIGFSRLAFNILHIKTLLDTYIDLQMSRMELASAQQEGTPPLLFAKQDDVPWMEVPVVLPNKQGMTHAKVSRIDYPQVIAISPQWRKSSSGYAIFVNVEGDTIYMHKFIHGGSAKHLNGDRLDNRRENLCNAIKKRKASFEIKEPKHQHINEFNTYQSYDPVLAMVNGFCKVEFPKGKYYVGQVEGGIPNGYGTMFKRDPPYEMDGVWKGGNIQTGIVKHLTQFPACMCPDSHPCPFREVNKVEFVTNGYKR